MARILETSKGISLEVLCGADSESRSVMREYFKNAEKLSALFEDLPVILDETQPAVSGKVKVALAYRMVVEHHLQQAWQAISVAEAVRNGDIDAKETRFSDLLAPENE